MEECFKRVETKYLISASQAAAIEGGLCRQGFVRMDFGSPRVQSLYYDTPEHELIRASLERPAFKEKLRLRVYGEPGASETAYLEIKRKFQGTGYKRRTAMPLAEALAALAAGTMPEKAGQVGREALWMLRRYDLRPAAVIACDRGAWTCGDKPEIRITFDRNITFRNWEMDMRLRIPGIPLLAGDQRLMEVKTGGVYPLWLTRLLQAAGAERVHFSKYGAAYERYIAPAKEGFEGSGSNCSIVSLRVGA